MHILVIDDDLGRTQWFRERLLKLGHVVDNAETAEGALRHLRRWTYDLAFFDHDLGEMQPDGSAIASEVLWHPEQYRCPKAVVVHSANPVGAKNIASKFASVGVPVVAHDFTNLVAHPEGLVGVLSTLPARTG